MSTDEQPAAVTSALDEKISETAPLLSTSKCDVVPENSLPHAQRLKISKELYSKGSRNFLVKNYNKAADQLSEVCALNEELYGSLSDELGMPYLLYAKSLIALALEENKVIDVTDSCSSSGEAGDEEDEEEEEAAATTTAAAEDATNGSKVDSNTGSEPADKKTAGDAAEKKTEEEITSTDDGKVQKDQDSKEDVLPTSTKANGVKETPHISSIDDGELPSTSTCEFDDINGEEEENDAASNLKLAWEVLELAAQIFTRQGERGLPNLAEVHTELANIEFENNFLEAARDDYEKALSIYKELPNNYRRAMAEIHYKIGLTFLMQQHNTKGAEALKEACNLIAAEIDEIKARTELSEKDKNNIKDMEETKQEIEEKITEIEETQAQNIADVRAALDSYINKSFSSGDVDAGSSKSASEILSGAAAAVANAPPKATDTLSSSSSSSLNLSSSSAAISSSSKPNDISHLIKRKKPEDPTSEAEASVCSPAKRPAI